MTIVDQMADKTLEDIIFSTFPKASLDGFYVTDEGALMVYLFDISRPDEGPAGVFEYSSGAWAVRIESISTRDTWSAPESNSELLEILMTLHEVQLWEGWWA